jgi:hypothetical protein
MVKAIVSTRGARSMLETLVEASSTASRGIKLAGINHETRVALPDRHCGPPLMKVERAQMPLLLMLHPQLPCLPSRVRGLCLRSRE